MVETQIHSAVKVILLLQAKYGKKTDYVHLKTVKRPVELKNLVIPLV